MNRLRRTLLAGLLTWAATLEIQAADAPEDRVLRLQPPRAVGDFSLVNQTGKPTSWNSLRGEPMLVFFGFTHCPDVCPTTLGQLKLITSRKNSGLDKVRVVFISVDGERDSPAMLKAYLGAFSPRFIGLTGDPRHVRPIAERFSAAFFKGQPDASGNYVVDHTYQVYLVDRKGQVRAVFLNSPAETIARVTRELAEEPN